MNEQNHRKVLTEAEEAYLDYARGIAFDAGRLLDRAEIVLGQIIQIQTAIHIRCGDLMELYCEFELGDAGLV